MRLKINTNYNEIKEASLKDLYTTCKSCGELCLKSLHGLCDDCHSDEYVECEGCGDVHHIAELTEDYYCSVCEKDAKDYASNPYAYYGVSTSNFL